MTHHIECPDCNAIRIYLNTFFRAPGDIQRRHKTPTKQLSSHETYKPALTRQKKKSPTPNYMKEKIFSRKYEVKKKILLFLTKKYRFALSDQIVTTDVDSNLVKLSLYYVCHFIILSKFFGPYYTTSKLPMLYVSTVRNTDSRKRIWN